jgi:hypothetical protein
VTQPNLDDERPVTAEELATVDSAALALMLTVMQHSRQETDHIVNGLMAGFQTSYYRTAAELEISRLQVEQLFTHGYMPTPDAVIDAMYHPDQAAVQARVTLFETRGF